MDSTWEPLIPTPPFPEYPSGHSTQSAAAATVLTALIGAVPFDDSTSISIGHNVRHFDSFNAAADEAGISRIYGGIHFPSGNTNGKALGRCIGEKVDRAVSRYDTRGDPPRRRICERRRRRVDRGMRARADAGVASGGRIPLARRCRTAGRRRLHAHGK